MNYEQVYADIQKLPAMAGAIRQRQPDAITYLRAIYQLVTGNTVYAGCRGCHIKAANYLMSLTLEKLKTMSEKKFTLKKGVRIEFPFRSGQLLTHTNMTDHRAAEYLLNNPKGLEHFSDYPQGENGLDLSEWYPSEAPVQEQPIEEAQAEAEAEEVQPVKKSGKK